MEFLSVSQNVVYTSLQIIYGNEESNLKKKKVSFLLLLLLIFIYFRILFYIGNRLPNSARLLSSGHTN